MNTTAEPAIGGKADVVLITAPDCHFCEDGKKVLARLAYEFPLAVREVSWTSGEGQQLAAQFGALFPPGLLLDGRFVGFGRISERKLRHLLERRVVAPQQRGG
jgi:hypothetical protein